MAVLQVLAKSVGTQKTWTAIGAAGVQGSQEYAGGKEAVEWCKAETRARAGQFHTTQEFAACYFWRSRRELVAGYSDEVAKSESGRIAEGEYWR